VPRQSESYVDVWTSGQVYVVDSVAGRLMLTKACAIDVCRTSRCESRCPSL